MDRKKTERKANKDTGKHGEGPMLLTFTYLEVATFVLVLGESSACGYGRDQSMRRECSILPASNNKISFIITHTR